MRLILGIDESGYGPRIGPLVVASCTLAAPESIPAVGAELTGQIFGAVQPPDELEPSDASPSGVYVGDSKLIHVEGWPLELERSALALVEWLTGEPADSIDPLLGLVAGQIDRAPPWLAPELGRFPLCERRPALPLSSRTVELRDVACHVLSARQLNAATEQSDNKALVNWALVAMLIERALARADEPVEIVVDRQGGRVHYEDLLRELFDSRVEIVEKTARRSAYTVVDRPDVRSIEFLVGGDSRCAAISIASIFAKYTRELLMARLNDYFCSRLEGLEPTEGYFRDGRRFVDETAELRARLGIADVDFIRSR